MQRVADGAVRVSELWVYPIKSLGGIGIEQATLLPKGFQYDRRWMLIDKDNQFMTQRLLPKLAQFRMSLALNGFSITYQSEQMQLPFTYMPQTLQAQVWEDEVQVNEVSAQHSEWFSDCLGLSCRLVFFPEQNTRMVDAQYAKHQEQVSLADGYPVLVIGQSSLHDLNTRLQEPVAMNRFRPSIVVSGSQPYEEDGWQKFTIGSANMEGVKPCGRCVVTTINQQSGITSSEPLATLSSYRKKGNSVLFGQNVLVRKSGVVAVNDEVILC